MGDPSTKRLPRVLSVAAIVAGISALLSGGPALAAPSLPCTTVPTLRDRCETWVADYDDPTIALGSHQLAPQTAASPDGALVFVSAIDEALNRSDPYHSPALWAVLAYEGATGAQLWQDTYQGPGHYDRPNAITVSPNGAEVYVTGGSYNDNPLSATDRNLMTIAYDAHTGARLWRTENVDPDVHDVGTQVLVSLDGTQVYVVANISGANGEIDWAAVGYDASDGHQLWRTPYTGLGIGKVNSPAGAALSHDGSVLYITGESGGRADYDADYATVAYATGGAQPGRQVWEARYDGVGQQLSDRSAAIAVDPDGRVVVTGDSLSSNSTTVEDDYATVAYDGVSGAQLWAARYTGPSGGINFGQTVATSSTQRIAVVSGESESPASSHDTDWETVGYDTVTGAQLWVQRLNTPGYAKEYATAAAVSTDGLTGFVTGFSGGRAVPGVTGVTGGDSVTIAYRLLDGQQQWVARYDTSEFDGVDPMGVAVANDGSVFVTAQLTRNDSTDQTDNRYDVVTLAYAGSTTPPATVPDLHPWWLLPLAAVTGGCLAARRRRRSR